MAVQGFLPPGSAVPLNPYNPGLPPQVAAVVGGRAASVASAPPTWLVPVSEVFNSYGVPASIWLPIAQLESGLNPNAVNGGGAPNQSAATGLFQIINARQRGVDATDPVASARWAAPKMRDAMRRTGSSDPVIVAINSDWPGNIASLPGGINYPEVQRWLANWRNGIAPMLQNPASQLSQLIGIASGVQEGTHEPAPIGGVDPNIGVDIPPINAGPITIPGTTVDIPNPFYGVLQWANEHRGAAVFIPLGIGLVVVGLVGLAFAGAQQVASSPGGQAAIAGATGGTSAVVRSVAVSAGVRRAQRRAEAPRTAARKAARTAKA